MKDNLPPNYESWKICPQCGKRNTKVYSVRTAIFVDKRIYKPQYRKCLCTDCLFRFKSFKPLN